MFVFKRNQIIITALVFMVAIAAYLNFTDNKNEVQPTFEDDAKQITQKDDLTYADTDFFEIHEFDEIGTLPPDMDMVAKEEEGDEEDTTKNKMINENKNAQAKADEKIDHQEVAVVNKSYDVNYFVEAKMDREQRRSEQVELLSECINNNTLDKESKSNAASNLITIQERIEKESGIESLLKAKGFKEVFVRISDDDVDVIINKEEIKDEDIAQIEDIVRRKTGYKASQIKISPLKN